MSQNIQITKISHTWLLALHFSSSCLNRIGNVLSPSAVDRGVEPHSGQTKNCKIGMCCFSDKRAALRRKSKDWLTRIQYVSWWDGGGATCLWRTVVQWASTIKIQLSVLVWYRADLMIISLKINYSWTIAELVLNNNHSMFFFWYKHQFVITAIGDFFVLRNRGPSFVI